MTTENENAIKVYVANLGKYNEGGLKGGWIELPVTDRKLKAFLRDTVGVETDPQKAIEAGMRGEPVYEEYAIHDFDFDAGLAALGFRPGEYENLGDLNLLARTVEVAANNGASIDGVGAYLASTDGCLDAFECANALLQADEIPLYRYDLPQGVTLENSTLEEAFGYQCADQSGLLETLKDANAEHCFDFAEYGSEQAMNISLCSEGYIDCCQSGPELDHYSHEEIAKEVNPEWESLHAGELAAEANAAHEHVFGVPIAKPVEKENAALSAKERLADARERAQAANESSSKPQDQSLAQSPER